MFKSLGARLLRNPITGSAGCCARAASGHAAAPPSSAMNSRRFMPGIGLLPWLGTTDNAADGGGERSYASSASHRWGG